MNVPKDGCSMIWNKYEQMPRLGASNPRARDCEMRRRRLLLPPGTNAKYATEPIITPVTGLCTQGVYYCERGNEIEMVIKHTDDAGRCNAEWGGKLSRVRPCPSTTSAFLALVISLTTRHATISR